MPVKRSRRIQLSQQKNRKRQVSSNARDRKLPLYESRGRKNTVRMGKNEVFRSGKAHSSVKNIQANVWLWLAATAIAAVTMMSYVHAFVYTRVEADKLEREVQGLPEQIESAAKRIEKRLDRLEEKVDSLNFRKK